MTGRQYEAILSALAEKIESLELENYCKDLRIEKLEKKLEEAEKHIEQEKAE